MINNKLLKSKLYHEVIIKQKVHLLLLYSFIISP